MKNILLVCGAGMSTSLLVKKMQEADMKHQYNIKCSDTVSAQIQLVDSDIFLLAPHISYMKGEFLPYCERLNIPFMTIDPLDYTKMDGVKVLEKVTCLLKEHEQDNPFKVVLLHAHGGAMSDLLVIDMKKKKCEEENDWVIESRGIDEFHDDGKTHMILLEPQLAYEEENVKRHFKNPFMLMAVPSRTLYATFDGRRILDFIHQVYDQQLQKKKIELKEGLENI